MTVIEAAKKALEDKKVALSPNRIYKIAEQMGLSKELNLKGKTPWDTFSARLYIDLKNNKNSIFEKTQNRPILIKLKNQSLNLKDEPQAKLKNKFHERDIHPLLVNFLYSNEDFNARAKTIYHENSKKSQKGHDKWLYPDIVGVNFEYEYYEDNVLKFANKFAKIPLKIYSFEIKTELNIANFREYYFQAVSNSSWANEGYLVALDVDESNNELIELITKLNLSFGIGVLSLNSEDLAQSNIIAPAKTRQLLDFNIINELCNKNPNFKDFLQTINDFDVTKADRFNNEFDKVLDQKELEKYLKDKILI